MLRRLGVGYGGQINVWSRIKIHFGFRTLFYKLDMFNNAENKPISKISSFTSAPPIIDHTFNYVHLPLRVVIICSLILNYLKLRILCILKVSVT